MISSKSKRFSLGLMVTGLERAISRKKPVTITYRDYLDRESTRTIEPYALDWTQQGHLIVRSLDRSRQTPRAFRVDRIRAYTIHYRGHRLLEHYE